jgi:hypothetical protein
MSFDTPYFTVKSSRLYFGRSCKKTVYSLRRKNFIVKTAEKSNTLSLNRMEIQRRVADNTGDEMTQKIKLLFTGC